MDWKTFFAGYGLYKFFFNNNQSNDYSNTDKSRFASIIEGLLGLLLLVIFCIFFILLGYIMWLIVTK